MSIVRHTSITIIHSDSDAIMPSSSPTWDVLFTVRSPASSIPDWHPTHWTRSSFQKLKFLQADKQKADGILRAARVLSSEISQHILIQETDSVGRMSISCFYPSLSSARGQIHECICVATDRNMLI